jgi:MFS family permease
MRVEGGVSFRSRIGLNAANFFLAQITGIAAPFLSDYLRSEGWAYDAIGVATSMSGLGVLLMQTPAGLLVDRIARPRRLFAIAALLVGSCYGLLPLAAARAPLAEPILFLSGLAQAFFAPLLAALALGLAGHCGLNRTIAVNQGWNHTGNIAGALVSLALVSRFGLQSVFYTVASVSVLAAASVLLIRSCDLDPTVFTGLVPGKARRPWAGPLRDLARDRRILVLIGATTLFQLASSTVTPLVALRVKDLKGSDELVALLILAANIVMVPVALSTGYLCDRFGRKPVFAVGFVIEPVRILACSVVTSPRSLVLLQGLSGIGMGIFGVTIVAMCADLTRERGGFNALTGASATALGLGSVLGPLLTGMVVQHAGFVPAFQLLAFVAATGAAIFLTKMPETRPTGPLPERALALATCAPSTPERSSGA